MSLRWNLILTLIRICRIQWWCLLFSFSTGHTLFRKFGLKNKNCQLKTKLGTWTNSNMQNSMEMFTIFVCGRKYPFWANLVQEIKLVSWRQNLVLKLIRICRIQWGCSLFFVYGQKYPFWANLVQKIETVSLRWRLIPTLIRICRIQWWCSLCFIFGRKYSFWTNLVQKIKTCYLA